MGFNFLQGKVKKSDDDLSNTDGGWHEDTIWEEYDLFLRSFRKYRNGERAVLKKLPYRYG